MGYRSDVKMLFGFDSTIKRDMFISAAKASMTGGARSWINSNDLKDEKDTWWWLIEWNNVKWYPDYDEVKAWEAVKKLADTWNNVTWEFIEVGEEDGDIKHASSDNNDDCRMYTSTSIHVDI